MKGGTTFTFVTDGVAAALERARAAAGDGSVAIAGGAATVNQYLAAGAIDELRLHVVPLILGAGERLFEGVADVRPGADLGQRQRTRHAPELPGVALTEYRAGRGAAPTAVPDRRGAAARRPGPAAVPRQRRPGGGGSSARPGRSARRRGRPAASRPLVGERLPARRAGSDTSTTARPSSCGTGSTSGASSCVPAAAAAPTTSPPMIFQCRPDPRAVRCETTCITAVVSVPVRYVVDRPDTPNRCTVVLCTPSATAAESSSTNWTTVPGSRRWRTSRPRPRPGSPSPGRAHGSPAPARPGRPRSSPRRRRCRAHSRR